MLRAHFMPRKLLITIVSIMLGMPVGGCATTPDGDKIVWLYYGLALGVPLTYIAIDSTFRDDPWWSSPSVESCQKKHPINQGKPSYRVAYKAEDSDCGDLLKQYERDCDRLASEHLKKGNLIWSSYDHCLQTHSYFIDIEAEKAKKRVADAKHRRVLYERRKPLFEKLKKKIAATGYNFERIEFGILDFVQGLHDGSIDPKSSINMVCNIRDSRDHYLKVFQVLDKIVLYQSKEYDTPQYTYFGGPTVRKSSADAIIAIPKKPGNIYIVGQPIRAQKTRFYAYQGVFSYTSLFGAAQQAIQFKPVEIEGFADMHRQYQKLK